MLKLEDGNTVIHSVITGGPAARSGAIHAGDKIVAVGNDYEALESTIDSDTYGDRNNLPLTTTTELVKFQDINGWRLEDVVDLIRGPKGTRVHLKIVRKDSLPGVSPESVSIVREKVELREQMARKETFDIEAGGKHLLLATIHLPAFYSGLFADQDSDDVRSSTRDVAELLFELNEQGVDGIVLDLRGNGGGALHEAVNLTSLFLKSGPIVQVNTSDGNVDVHYDDDDLIYYEGPLVVLVDRFSASASEILAGAIQDYKRGIVVGETTFGKGTLQSIMPLGDQNDRNAGSLKLSTAQFYRINGTSNQFRGVVPDVLFVTNQFVHDSGERSLRNALVGNVIDPIKQVIPWRNASAIENRIPELRRFNKERMEMNPVFDYLVQTERLREERNSHVNVSLSEQERKQTIAQDEESQLNTLNSLRAAPANGTCFRVDDRLIPVRNNQRCLC